MDSLLMKHLITPTLNDSSMIRVKAPDFGHASVMIKHLESDTSVQPEIIAFRMEDSIGLEEERLVRSVKLFINKTDEAYRSNSRAHVFTMNIDSLALLHMLGQKFEEKDWNFKMDWLQGDYKETQEDQIPGIVLTSTPHMELSALHIQQIAPYLLGLLLPQFIFALILLSLSASALIIAYRSLKKQELLNEVRNDFISNISHELKTPVSTVKVEDNGPGIPEEFRHQVYDKFFRIPAGNRHNVKGYGLGLNFAAQVMAQMGGSISFRNLAEKGCEFTLDFPKE